MVVASADRGVVDAISHSSMDRARPGADQGPLDPACLYKGALEKPGAALVNQPSVHMFYPT